VALLPGLLGIGPGPDGPSIQGTIRILDPKGRAKARPAGVVVFLDELDPPQPLPPPGRASLRQIRKSFVPEVLPILVGTTVDFPNEDRIYHNVFSLSRIQPFDLGIYEQGASRSVTFERIGLVNVYCNIHSQMAAFILVLANPYFTTTDPEGRFVLRDVPLGTATLRTWSPRSRRHPERRIRITPEGLVDLELGPVQDLELELIEDAVSVEHSNKWGQSYPSKYSDAP
jgi:hypothetical protein